MAYSTIKVYTQNFSARLDEGQHFFEADWTLPRIYRTTYTTPLKGSNACEQCFHIFNAPEEMLNEYEQVIRNNAVGGASLSVGDVVEVDGEEYICCSMGWEKKS